MEINGITVILHERIAGPDDDFGNQTIIYATSEVKDCLVSPTTSDDVITDFTLEGKKEVYTIAVPKGDTHTWEDAKVEFFGRTYKQFGAVMQGIEANLPLRWNKKVTVERYEQG